jgi:hypothetical protein
MARPKKPDFSNHAAKMEAAFKKYDYEAVEGLLYDLHETIEVPDGFDLPKEMRNDWEMVPREGGMLLRKNAAYRLKVHLALLPYRHPQLKSSESKEQHDYNITWTVKQFTVHAVAAPELGKAIDAPQVRMKELHEDGA